MYLNEYEVYMALDAQSLISEIVPLICMQNKVNMASLIVTLGKACLQGWTLAGILQLRFGKSSYHSQN